MAIANFKVAEFSTAREAMEFIVYGDDPSTFQTTLFNTASGKYTVFYIAATSSRSFVRRTGETVTANATFSSTKLP